MMQDFQFGLKNGKIVHAEAVQSGIQCNCYCPACGGRFIAYKGPILRAHFKHITETDCKYSFETSLHFLAKEIIQKKKFLDVPFLTWEIPFTPSSWFPAHNSHGAILPPFEKIQFKRVYFDKVEVEQWEGNFKPDLKCYAGDKLLFIEIKVSHGIDEYKLEKIKSTNIPLLEIDLSGFRNEINKKSITQQLYQKKDFHFKTRTFRWIHNPKNDKLSLVHQHKSERIFNFINQHRRPVKLYGRDKEIYNCPLLPKAQAPFKFVDTCEYCSYNLGKIDLSTRGEQASNKRTERAIICIGHKKYELETLLKECGAKAQPELLQG